MPIYEYQCPNCGHEFDKIVKFSDPSPPCPSCDHDEVTKKVSQTSFQLKGTGWYVTDYKSRPGASTSPSSTNDSGDSGSGDSSSDAGGGDASGGSSSSDSSGGSSSSDASGGSTSGGGSTSDGGSAD